MNLERRFLKKLSINVGDRVKFNSSRRKELINQKGTITKINKTEILVLPDAKSAYNNKVTGRKRKEWSFLKEHWPNFPDFLIYLCKHCDKENCLSLSGGG